MICIPKKPKCEVKLHNITPKTAVFNLKDVWNDYYSVFVERGCTVTKPLSKKKNITFSFNENIASFTIAKKNSKLLQNLEEY